MKALLGKSSYAIIGVGRIFIVLVPFFTQTTQMNPLPYKIVIPSRYASSRLPGKPLLDIAGKPMIEWVYRQAQQTSADELVVATDDQRIFNCVKGFGGEVEMTSDLHESGTDRLAEVARIRGWEDSNTIVNLQGDEPLMNPQLVDAVAQSLIDHADAGIATAATSISETADIFDPNVVKVVLDQHNRALYFSRASIPWHRNDFQDPKQLKPTALDLPLYRHLGLYAYRNSTLQTLTELPPCALEQAEALEQLRALCNGISIYVHISEMAPGHGVDTREDLNRVRALLTQ